VPSLLKLKLIKERRATGRQLLKIAAATFAVFLQ
jgi:hypothetical protein